MFKLTYTYEQANNIKANKRSGVLVQLQRSGVQTLCVDHCCSDRSRKENKQKRKQTNGPSLTRVSMIFVSSLVWSSLFVAIVIIISSIIIIISSSSSSGSMYNCIISSGIVISMSISSSSSSIIITVIIIIIMNIIVVVVAVVVY